MQNSNSQKRVSSSCSWWWQLRRPELRFFCTQVLRQPELDRDDRFAGNAKRVAHREALHALIVAVFADLTAEQVQDRIEAAQIANAQVNDMAGLWNHAQLKALSEEAEKKALGG